MKKILTSIIITAMLFMLCITVVGATEAETPMQEYVRNGVTYRMYSVAMSKSVPKYNEYLERIAEKLFGEKPLIYGFIIDPRIQSVLGFQKEYSDGSKAIYINESVSFSKGTQIFVHEMVHYKYDFSGAIMYAKDSNGCYRYKQLMEAMTDVIAKEMYATISKNEYKEAYCYPVLDRLIQEDKEEILISLYKGELILPGECTMILDKINKSIKYGYMEEAIEALEELEDMAEKDGVYTSSFFVMKL